MFKQSARYKIRTLITLEGSIPDAAGLDAFERRAASFNREQVIQLACSVIFLFSALYTRMSLRAASVQTSLCRGIKPDIAE
jgi:hypothetical protein